MARWASGHLRSLQAAHPRSWRRRRLGAGYGHLGAVAEGAARVDPAHRRRWATRPALGTRLEPLGPAPAPRAWHRAIYDPEGDRMIVYGGFDGGPVNRSDLWALSLAGTPTWSELFPSGTGPGPRSAHSLIYDPDGKR